MQLKYLSRAYVGIVGFQRAAESGGLLDAAHIADVEQREVMVAAGVDASDATEGDLRIEAPCGSDSGLEVDLYTSSGVLPTWIHIARSHRAARLNAKTITRNTHI